MLDVVAEHVDGDAQVVKAGGEALAGRVILLATVEPVTIHANGSISILDTEARRDGGTEKSGLARPLCVRTFGGEGGNAVCTPRYSTQGGRRCRLLPRRSSR